MIEKIKYEEDVKNVLKEDGIKDINIDKINFSHYKTKNIEKDLDKESWAKRIIYNETHSAVLICQKPGETNRTHFHKSNDEWWVILAGKIKWWIEGEEEIIAEQGDIVFAKRGKQHKIKTVGTKNSVRLAVSCPDIPHFHPENDNAPEDF